jgi:hypothetical protein
MGGGAVVLRRPPRGRSIWIVPNPLFAEPSAGASVKVPYRRFGKWKPLGIRKHVSSDPTLLQLSNFLWKRDLMEYVCRAAATDLVVVPLVEKWKALTPAAQRAVTLTDLCRASGVTPARFIAAAARGSVQTGHFSVLLALSIMDLPEDVKLAVREWFA